MTNGDLIVIGYVLASIVIIVLATIVIRLMDLFR